MNWKQLAVPMALGLSMLAVGASAAKKEAAPKAAAPTPTPDAAKPADGQVSRGEYLVKIMACADCHTPMAITAAGTVPDKAKFLSGHPERMIMPPAPKLPPGPWVSATSASNTAFAGPWGISFAANLTPDKNTGLGSWTEQMFMDAIRNGKHKGTARAILPPMPFGAYSYMNERDLKAVFAYLKSIPAIPNRVPEPKPPVAAEPKESTPKDAPKEAAPKANAPKESGSKEAAPKENAPKTKKKK